MIFKDLVVIELATVLAGPSVGMFFAELGAKVIKIEHPQHPDVTRSWKSANEQSNHSVTSYFSSINYQKKYEKLDLKEASDYQKLLQLLENADILLSNFKKGDAEKLKLTAADLQAINPKLIHGKITGFGSESDRVAYDLILQAETGFMSMNGTPESGPVKMPVALIDVLAAHHLKEGILCALLERHQTNLGKTVEVSLYDAAVCSLVNQASSYLMTQQIPKRIGSLHPSIAPYGEIFNTANQDQVTFAIGSDLQFQKLLNHLNLAEYLKDERFSSNALRVKNREALANLLQEKLSTCDTNELLTWSLKEYVPCGKIKNLNEVFEAKEAQQLIREEEIDGVLTRRVTSIAF